MRLTVRLDWLASKLHRPTCTWVVGWDCLCLQLRLRVWTHISCLERKHFTKYWSPHPTGWVLMNSMILSGDVIAQTLQPSFVSQISILWARYSDLFEPQFLLWNGISYDRSPWTLWKSSSTLSFYKAIPIDFSSMVSMSAISWWKVFWLTVEIFTIKYVPMGFFYMSCLTTSESFSMKICVLP